MNGTLARLNKRSVSGRGLKHEYGLFTVVGRDPNEDSLTDIIAIHGLNGHYENTWSTEREDGVQVNWLRDLLPKRLPNTRILSFSYNSRVQFSKSTSDISDFAAQLLVQLLAARRTKAEMARPIVFICHSLGGIVFKEALAIATQDSRYYLTIAVHVSGVAFFGTPHRGSSLASWGGFLSTVLKTGSFATSTNALLTKDLEQNSRVLERISNSFTLHGQSLEIFSFYETEKMNYANCKVVEKESATLGWPKEAVIPIDGNHRSMCWFTHEDEPRFQSVWTSLECLVSKSLSSEHLLRKDFICNPPPEDPDQMIWTRRKILLGLHKCDYVQHKERNPTAVDGTCVWIFKHPKYQSWLTETGHSLLWVSADAGCGKSVLASFLVDYHKKHSAGDINVCYFFFKADNNEQRNAVYGLSVLLHQLYMSQDGLIQNAEEFLKGETPESGKGKLAHTATLWKLFTDATENAEARPTICIIDGLDECEENSRKQLIQLIHGYYTLPSEDQKVQGGTQKKLRLLVTSRPDNSIKVAFDRQEELERSTSNRSVKGRKNRTRFAIMRLRGEDETEAVGHDIELVIRDAMDEIDAGGLPSELSRYMEEELISRADRTFLWVKLIIGLLRERVAEGASRREIDLILKSRSVDAIYAVLLSSNANQAKARKLLNIILAAVEPLTIEELSIALAVQPEHQTSQKSSQPRRPNRKTFEHVELNLAYPFENHIKGLCGHFVRIVQSKVYLVHQTAREFLLDRASQEDGPLGLDDELDDAPEEMWLLDGDTNDCHSSSYFQQAGSEATTLASEDFDSAWQHTFSLLEAHAILLEICVTYLYMLGKTSRRPRADHRQCTPATSAFLKYAASSWGLHFREVRYEIHAHDLPYYYGLCHPKFPGFESWLCKSGLPQKELSEILSKHLIGVSEDGVQDHVIRRLKLELESWAGSAYQLNSIKSPGWLSTNPAASENSYFPVGVDKTGFVSLRSGQKMKSSTYPARVAAQWREHQVRDESLHDD